MSALRGFKFGGRGVETGLRTIEKRLSDPRVRRSLFRVLRSNVLCSIATVTQANRAHINTAYFAFSADLDLYFLSDSGSLHCKNLGANPSMAIDVFSSTQTWGRPDRGVQLFGSAHEARGREIEAAARIYARRFRPYGVVMSGTSKQDRRQARQLGSYRFYRFVPTRIKILDEREFGGGVFIVTTVEPPAPRRSKDMDGRAGHRPRM